MRVHIAGISICDRATDSSFVDRRLKRLEQAVVDPRWIYAARNNGDSYTSIRTGVPTLRP